MSFIQVQTDLLHSHLLFYTPYFVNSIVYQSTIDRCLGCFQFFTTKSAAIYIFVRASLIHVLVFLKRRENWTY